MDRQISTRDQPGADSASSTLTLGYGIETTPKHSLGLDNCSELVDLILEDVLGD